MIETLPCRGMADYTECSIISDDLPYCMICSSMEGTCQEKNIHEFKSKT